MQDGQQPTENQPAEQVEKIGETPITPHARLATINTVEELEAGFSGYSKEELNSVVGGKTPLTIATVTGRADFVKALIKLGSDPNRALAGGVTALHLATKLRLASVVQALCDGGADPHHPADNGPSALSLALGQSDFECYGILAGFFVRGHEGADNVHALFEVLRAAVAKGQPAFLDNLLTKFPEFSVTDRVVAYCAREGNGDVMTVLLKHGGRRGAVERGQHDIPALVLAAALGNASALEAMLSFPNDEKLDLDQECLGLTPLMHAAKEGHADCVQSLIKHGAVVEAARGTSGWTALFFACNKERLHVVTVLLAHGADPKHASSDGTTALHVTTDNRIVELLLQKGADPNALDKDLRTPLFRPALVADYMSIMHLFRYGADPVAAHKAHLQRMKNEEAKAANPEFVPQPGLIEDIPFDQLDPVDWIPSTGREDFIRDYVKEQEMGHGKCSRLDLVRDLLNRGLTWIPWKTSNHSIFPKNVRLAIRATVMSRKRSESLLSLLPRDVLLHVCSFVATPSPAWRLMSVNGNSSDWDWCKEFTVRCWEFKVQHMMSPQVRACLDKGQCTKHLTGVDYMFQPFYKCTTCKFGGEFGNNLGMCRSCKDRCHADHETDISGFLPAFCDCGDSARCQLDSQWSLLSKEAPTDDEKDGFRFFIAICSFHDPNIFRELRRPENLLHAVPGDIIKVDAKLLDQPGLMCEGFLHGEKGEFPASRSYVLPIREFVRALQDSGPEVDSSQLKFKQGDLIHPLGVWDGNAPENVSSVQLMKGRLITPNGNFQEGWFLDSAVDLIANYDIFCKDGVNVKKALCDKWIKAKELSDTTNLAAIPLFLEFRKEFSQVLGTSSRETFKLGLMSELAGIEVANLYRLLRRYKDEQEVLEDVIKSLDDVCKAQPDNDGVFNLRARARAWLVMSYRNSRSPAAGAHWAKLIDQEEMDRVTSSKIALLRLGVFAYVEALAKAPDALKHAERLKEGLAESKLPREHELSRLSHTIMIRACLNEEREMEAVHEYVSLLETLEDMGDRPLELLTELMEFGSMLLLRQRANDSAIRVFERFQDLWEHHPEYHSCPELIAMAYECSQFIGLCLTIKRRQWFVTDLLLNAWDKVVPEERSRLNAVIVGRGLRASVTLKDHREFGLTAFLSDRGQIPAGRVLVYVWKVGTPKKFSPAHIVNVEANQEVVELEPIKVEETTKVKLVFVDNDDISLGVVSFFI